MRSGLIALVIVFTMAAQDNPQQRRFPIEKITIGGTRFSQSAVLEIAGLKIGAPANEADFEAAAQRLQASGLFQNVGFQFAPGPQKGYVLSFTITDYPEWLRASIEVPGVSQDEIWKCVEARFPILAPKSVPQNDRAEIFYANAIQQCVASTGRKDEIIPRTFSALNSGPDDVVFRPKTLPLIAALKLQGTKAVSSEVLLKALSPVAMGSEYTERAFREMLQRNVVPIYEELGYLRTSFPAIAVEAADAHSVVVTTTVDEGSVYTLGEVTVVGEGVDGKALLRIAPFRRGQLANWSDILKHIQDMEQPLRRKGYMATQLVPERSFDDAAHVVNVKIVVQRGAPFYFGKLTLKGLSPELEQLARAAWAPKPGEAMDEEYPTEFLKNLRDRPEFANLKFELALETGAAQNIMDVIITAR